MVKGAIRGRVQLQVAFLSAAFQVAKQAASRTGHETSWHPALLRFCHCSGSQVATGCSWVLQSFATGAAVRGHGRQDSRNCTGLLWPEGKTHISCSLHSLSMLCFC